jgi:hypothetical protein
MKIVHYLTAMAAVAAALSITAPARADISFFLTTEEGGTIISPPTSAVEVTVSLTDSTHAVVTFTPPSGNTNVLPPVEINVSGFFQASSTEGLASTSPCDNISGGVTNCATGGDGAGFFGTMSLETGASDHPSVVINLLALNGNSWANEAAVLTPNSKGFEALVDQCSNSIVTQCGGASAVPGPIVGAGFPGLIAACGGLLALGRRRRRQRIV